MGVELELSELAVLRPIQTAAVAATAASSAGAAATTRPGNDGPDAADTGCVTPKATSSLLPPRQLGFGADVDDAVCVTPTTSPCVLRAATVCPPAPRKPAREAPYSTKRKRCCTDLGLQRSFFPVPRDLSTVFVPRGAPAATTTATARSPPRAAKKIRLHVVV